MTLAISKAYPAEILYSTRESLVNVHVQLARLQTRAHNVTACFTLSVVYVVIVERSFVIVSNNFDYDRILYVTIIGVTRNKRKRMDGIDKMRAAGQHLTSKHNHGTWIFSPLQSSLEQSLIQQNLCLTGLSREREKAR